MPSLRCVLPHWLKNSTCPLPFTWLAVVYADLSKIADANAYPREEFHEYLRSLMRANLGDRLMFASDAAGPGALGPSIDGISSATFLSDGQKRAILCENAARFFLLTTRPGK